MAKKDQKAILAKMSDMARAWPRPGELVYYIEPDHIWLHKIRLPSSSRGQGTQRMCAFLHLCDQLGKPVTLTADPVNDDDDEFDIDHASVDQPTTFDLVRWYKRLGFHPIGPSEDGFVMERPAQNPKPIEQMLKDYKSKSKMSWDEFAAFFKDPPARRTLGPA